MSRLLCLCVALAALLSGCSSTASGGDAHEQQTSLQGTLLTVPLARKGPHTGYKDQRFALFRLVNPAQADDNTGIARLELKKEHINVAVEKRSVVEAVATDGAVHFSLPPDFNAGNDCFVMVNLGSWVTPRAGETTVDARHLIALKPFAARKEVFDARKRLDAAFEERQLAERRLASNGAYRHGDCVRPEMDLPARPQGAMTYEDALPLAEAIVVDSMTRRLGCEVTSELLQRAGLMASWRRFLARFTCGRTDLHELVPQTDLTPFIDYLESRLLSCAAEDKLGCLVAYVLVISQRFNVDRDRVASRLSASHYRWERETADIRSAAARALVNCRTDMITIQLAPAVHTAAEGTLAKAEEASKRFATTDGAYRGATLRCDRTIADYVSHRGSARFVGVR